MDGLLRTATDAGRFQNWPATVGILVIVALATFVVGLVRRPAFSKSAPQLVYGGGYPVLGMLRFFSERRNFIRDAARATKSGHFSFYFGKLQVVNVSGIEGRRTFLESRELNMSEGYATLFATTPRMRRDGRGESRLSLNKWFSHTIIAMMRKENFVRNLPQLVADTQGQLASLVARREAESGSAGADTLAGTFDPFVDINRIVYQLTMRTVGADDIAESPELLDKTLSLFEQIESSSSPARIIFPWLPTFGYIKRMSAGFRLFMTFKRIADDRRKSGCRRKDALQYLLDGGESMERIVTFVAGALFAGQINSGVNAAWMLVYLACDPYWYGRIRNEVDEAVHRHRSLPSQSAADVLGSLTVDDWETEFPLIDLCLRECIRVQMVGTAFRKNISNKDVPIG
ncbi:Cytochrome P450 [Niveomyces insectorum RCEF 264]|uniref:Cytochrome P450 n=1 Tax=Niveomyces insectorum RCEF 264 TaxID=1081102 RepID=A0A167PCM5_9HYPO|nr:Cytochrome P450 [Niveomyces insectorum RCEF 264]